MEDLKYKAWVNSLEEYRDIQFLDVINKRVMVVESDYWLTEEEYELSKWSGHYDKNGKKLYDNDVVTCYICCGPAGDQKVTIIIQTGKDGINIEDWNFMDTNLVTKIGNIRENPELKNELTQYPIEL